MDLVDHYLKSVSRYLPSAQKDDIIKELSENIRSEIEDREGELGRALSESEQEVVVKRHGHPLLVAGRYRQDQRSVAFGRQWIGPVLFPFYIKVLFFNLGISFTVIFLVFVGLFAGGQSVTFSDAASAFFLQLAIQFGIVTLIFTLVDKHLNQHPDRWDPRKPAQLEYPEFLEAKLAKTASQVPRLQSISQLIASAVFLVWFRATQGAAFLIFGPAAPVFRLAPVWHQVYAPSVIIILVGMAQAGINLVRPDWIRFRSAARLVAGAITLGVVYFLMRAGDWVVLANPDASASGANGHAMEIINQSIFYSLLLAGLIVVLLFLRDLWRLVRAPHGQVASRA
jgi:hypothetical protein